MAETLMSSASVQSLNPYLDITPPLAKLFERQYIDHPMDESHGLPQIEIPLYVINLDGLEIPIKLVYHAGGVKYKQHDGDVGVGWSIQASGGYRVNRELHGKPDEITDFFNITDYNRLRENTIIDGSASTRMELDRYLAFATSMSGPPSGFEQYPSSPTVNTKFDPEYDRFTYMLPSTSGHFVINDRENNNVSIMEQHADKIKLFRNIRNYLGLEIIDENGFTHLLGSKSNENAIEIVWPVSQLPGTPCFQSWLIKEIKSPLGNKLEYTYTNYLRYLGNINREAVNYRSAISELSSYPITGANYATGNYSTPQIVNETIALPTKIKTNNISIEFVRSTVMYNEGMITQMKVLDSFNKPVKIINFEYSSHSDNNWHIQLLGITIQNPQNPNETVERYAFQYYPNTYLNRDTASPDGWGYYNTFATIKPDYIKQWTDKSFLKTPLLSEWTGNFSKISNIESLSVGSHLRNCGIDMFKQKDPNKESDIPNMFSLKKITYPTGGSSEYIYENNQWNNQLSQILGAGLRIKRIKTKTAEKEYYTDYQYNNGQLNVEGYGVSLFKTINNYITSIDIQFLRVTYHETFSFYEKPYIGNNISVRYKDVTIINQDGSRGRMALKYSLPRPDNTITYYNNQARTIDDNIVWVNRPDFNSMRFVYVVNMGNDKPELTNKYIYDANDNLVREETYAYKQKNILSQPLSQNLSATQRIFIGGGLQVFNSIQAYSIYGVVGGLVESRFDHGLYTIKERPGRLLETKETKEDNITLTENYIYNNKNRLIETQKIDDSRGTNLKSKYTYPENYNYSPYKEMVAYNILTPLIEQSQYKGESFLQKQLTQYKQWISGLFKPEFIQTQTNMMTSAENRIQYHNYDKYGNPLYITKDRADKVVYLWAYNGQYPIAEIRNATFSQAEEAAKSAFGVADIDQLSSSVFTESEHATLLNKLHALRNHNSLKDAHVATYTYKSLVGMLTATDPSGITTYYDYDSLGRLRETYIMENNIKKVIQTYDYHYQNQ